jgi:hypothetical protein
MIGIPAAGAQPVVMTIPGTPPIVFTVVIPGSPRLFTKGVPWVTVATLATIGAVVTNGFFTLKVFHLGSPVVLAGATISIGPAIGIISLPVPNPSLFVK